LRRKRDEAEAETRRELRRNRNDLEEATGGSEEGEREGKRNTESGDRAGGREDGEREGKRNPDYGVDNTKYGKSAPRRTNEQEEEMMLIGSRRAKSRRRHS